MTWTITTRTICTSEHSSAPLVVFPVLMSSHDLLGSSRSRVCHLIFTSCICAFFFDSSTSLSTSTCPSPSSSTPLSWCTLTCTPTSTTWTPWKITCATPPRGATTPTTSPSPSHWRSPTFLHKRRIFRVPEVLFALSVDGHPIHGIFQYFKFFLKAYLVEKDNHQPPWKLWKFGICLVIRWRLKGQESPEM